MSGFVGLSAADAFRELVRGQEDIETLYVFEYGTPPALHARVSLHDDEERLVAAGKDLHIELGLPFWDALLTACMRERRLPAAFLSAALFHQEPIPPPRPIEAARVRVEGFAPDLAALAPGRMLAICSAVDCRGVGRAHLPLLDFHSAVSDENLAIVREVTGALLGSPALVLESGHSYHAVGRTLLTPAEHLVTLAKALLLGPITDRAYIAHQLMQGTSSLRISRGGREDRLSAVVAEI